MLFGTYHPCGFARDHLAGFFRFFFESNRRTETSDIQQFSSGIGAFLRRIHRISGVKKILRNSADKVHSNLSNGSIS
jgi:hypothetical protein